MEELSPFGLIAATEDQIVRENRRHSTVLLSCVVVLLSVIGVLILLNKPDLLWIIIPILIASVLTILHSEREHGPAVYAHVQRLMNTPGIAPLKVVINRVLNQRRLTGKSEIYRQFLERFAELLASGSRDLNLTTHEQGVIFGFTSAVLINPAPSASEAKFAAEVMDNADWLLYERQRKTLELLRRIRSTSL